MGVEFKASGFQKRIREMRARAPVEAEAFVTELTNQGLTAAKALCPVDSGELRLSLLPEPVGMKDGEITGGYATNSDHALFVEYGTGQRGLSGAVANGAEKDPEPVDYREDWPGMPAQPYMYPSVKSLEENLPETLKKLGQKIIGGAGSA